MTFRELLNNGIAYLEGQNIDEAKISAWQLMEFVWDINRSYYFAHSDDIIKEKQIEEYMSLIRRRGEHIPLQYLTNKAYFMGYTFHVNKYVLIPRLDTEVLVGETLKVLKPQDKVLDMCTGSGCVIISLLLEMINGVSSEDIARQGNNKNVEGIRGTGVDISKEALEVAKKNARNLGIAVDFIESDLFENVVGKYNVIVSNPPYIRTTELAELMPEVREHEPLLALDGSEDGLDYYRRIVKEAKNFLEKWGWLVFEIGYDEGEDVLQMMETDGYKDVRIIKDLGGLDRVVTGQRE